MQNLIKALALAWAGMAVANVMGAGDVITVCSSGCEYTSINDAIGAAEEGDIIQLSPEVYVEGAPITTQGRSFILRGATTKDGSPASILDGGGKHRVIDCADGVNLEDLIIQNGMASEGGGVLVTGGVHVTLTRCILTGNTAEFGGPSC